MPRIAGRPNQNRERFMAYYDRATLTDADRLADKLNAEIPEGRAKVSRSDVLREAAKVALELKQERIMDAVRATHPSLRSRET